MKLKVDLECEKCYKKVKKLLTKYPRESFLFLLDTKIFAYVYLIFQN